MQGRQCTVSIGSVLADIYIVAATVNPTVQFYAERADRGPSMHLQSGPASCLATVEGTGKAECSSVCCSFTIHSFFPNDHNGTIKFIFLSYFTDRETRDRALQW